MIMFCFCFPQTAGKCPELPYYKNDQVVLHLQMFYSCDFSREIFQSSEVFVF